MRWLGLSVDVFRQVCKFRLIEYCGEDQKEVMVCQAASQTRFRAFKHENSIEGESTIIVRVIACFQPLHYCQAEYFRHLLKPVTMLPKPSLLGHPAYLNSSTCIFPAVSTFPGLASPAIPNLKTELRNTNEVQGFYQYPNAGSSFKETHIGGALQNGNTASLQKKLLVFDHSCNKTRLFYGPALPLVQSSNVTATKFAYDVNGEGQASNMGQKYQARTYVMQEQFEGADEEVASSDWPNKRLKLIDGGYNRSSPPVDSVSLVKLKETCECVSDAESKNSSGWAYSFEKTKVDNSMVDDIKLKRDRIRESLRVLENLIPGAKGKEPLLVIDGTIEYLKFLMSQTGTLGVKYH
ncbi:hypothetical protein SESBI_40312 [Sesbania bispinosa]|nr:hypothetical protein SESBI_40312 [Sesbania bispinosa]